jgi:hypothetical protein
MPHGVVTDRLFKARMSAPCTAMFTLPAALEVVSRIELPFVRVEDTGKVIVAAVFTSSRLPMWAVVNTVDVVIAILSAKEPDAR